MKRILIISNVTAGLTNFRYELIETLVKEYEVYAIAQDDGRGKILSEMGVKFSSVKIDCRGTDFFNDYKLYRFYMKMIKSIKPDIVLTYTIKPNIYGGIAASKNKIQYICNITGLGTAIENDGPIQKIAIPLYKKGIKNAKKVFFQNVSNYEFMKKRGMLSSPHEIIPGSGVNLDKYPLLDYPNGDKINLVFISRVIKEKGIEQFLDAAQYFHEKRPDVCFHVCGGCKNEFKEILNELNEKGVVVYHGRVEDVKLIHKISSCTIHPTYYPEGMSNVLLESAACGRPIITTDRAGCRETVDVGVSGYLVKERDSMDLIEKIEQFLDLPWEKRRDMGLAGRAKVEKEFDRRIVISRYLDAIEN